MKSIKGGDVLSSLAAAIPEFQFWQSQLVDGLHIIESSDHAMSYPEHLHDVLEIIWLKSGAGHVRQKVRQKRRSYFFHAGQAAVIPPHQPHSGEPLPGFSFYLLHIPVDSVRVALSRRTGVAESGIDFLPLKILPAAQANRLLAGFIRNSVAAADRDRQLQLIVELVAGIWGRSARLRPARCRHDVHPAIRRAVELIGANFTGGVSLTELASTVGLDERYLVSLFKSEMGLPPNQFQIAMRVDLARRLIQEDLPLSSAAAAAGFADQSHLNRHFKRQYGMTPGAFQGISHSTS